MADASEVQPTELVTVYERFPAAIPERVVLAVFPVMFPGFIVQFPVGSPVNSMLPVANEQVGCVIVPAVGAEGVTGCALIITFVDPNDVHPTEFVTVNA